MEERWPLYFDEIPCYVTVIDQELRIMKANRRFREEFGDRVGEHCYKVAMNREEKCEGCPAELTFQDGKPHEGEKAFISPSGECFGVQTAAIPIRNEAGGIVEVLEMAIGAVQRNDAQARLASLNALVGSISHAIKGQLTGLDGGFYMMKSGYEKSNPDRVKKGMSMVQRNVERISIMVQDVLYYAKDREPLREEIRLQDVIGEFAETMGKKAKDAGVELMAEIAKGIGSLEADPRMIRAMLANIIYHAFESCRADQQQGQHRITLSVSEDDTHVIFRIVDNGACTLSEIRDKIFTPLFSPQGVGETGLGLFVSNKLATNHRGWVKGESRPRGGNTVVVTIPKRASGMEA